MGGLFRSALILSCAMLAGCQTAMPVDRSSATPSEAQEIAAIRALIKQMEAAWNHGDFEGYMAGFANPDVTFVSYGQFRGDWDATLARYKQRYGEAPEGRGRLHFWNIDVEMLGPDAAQLISRYCLVRDENPQDGINTRLMRKREGKWVIALNHVSSREEGQLEGDDLPAQCRP